MYRVFYDRKVRLVRDLGCGDRRVYVATEIRRVDCPRCDGVKQERLAWLADNPFYTKRFALTIGRRCRDATIKAVAEEYHLDWHTVKELDKQYMREQLRRAGAPRPRVLGLDEISIRKRHQYRIVVSDLERERPIWFGGKDRTAESLKLFYDQLGEEKCLRIQLAVMDMWPAFELATREKVPQAAILYDKFHVLRHLQNALDQIRREEYARLRGPQRRFIKGQRYTLLSRPENLSVKGRTALRQLLGMNRRLHTAYLLKESFDQLWEYQYPASARKFFDNWRDALKWQRLEPYRKFAKMVERHWEGIVAYCRPENKISLGFVEGLNNKIRVIQRRAYGLRDEEYLRLKVLTCTLKPL